MLLVCSTDDHSLREGQQLSVRIWKEGLTVIHTWTGGALALQRTIPIAISYYFDNIATY